MTNDQTVILGNNIIALRTAVTKIAQQIESELKKEKPDDDGTEELLEKLNDKFESTKAVDKQIEPLFKPTKIDRELETVEPYREKIVTWRFQDKMHLWKSNEHKAYCESYPKTEAVKLTEVINVKLPKINIPKFYGEINQWL